MSITRDRLARRDAADVGGRVCQRWRNSSFIRERRSYLFGGEGLRRFSYARRSGA
jgi:hypothetical protein